MISSIQAKAVTAAFEQLSYKEQWYLEKRNAICMTCGRVSPLSTQSTFEDLAVDFEGTTASGAERFYRRTLDKLRLKLLESGVIHTVTLKQTDMDVDQVGEVFCVDDVLIAQMDLASLHL